VGMTSEHVEKFRLVACEVPRHHQSAIRRRHLYHMYVVMTSEHVEKSKLVACKVPRHHQAAIDVVMSMTCMLLTCAHVGACGKDAGACGEVQNQVSKATGLELIEGRWSMWRGLESSIQGDWTGAD
jgi:hypothetical protein